jgi:hypothetical protein
MISECNCCKNKNENPELDLEDGNCICTECNCHYFRRFEKSEVDNKWLQNHLRNYGMVILGTSTLLYGIYIFCCEKHLSYFFV